MKMLEVQRSTLQAENSVPTWHTFLGRREFGTFFSELVAILAAARRCACRPPQGFMACEYCEYSDVRVQIWASKLPYVTRMLP